jgi:hypothetical protein
VNPVATALSAIANVSLLPADEALVLRMLRTGEGDRAQLHGLFGDVAASKLLQIADLHGIPADVLLAAYAVARERWAVANPGLDALAAERGRA